MPVSLVCLVRYTERIIGFASLLLCMFIHRMTLRALFVLIGFVLLVWFVESTFSVSSHPSAARATASVISGAVTGPVSRDPAKDILEVSRAFAALYEVDGCSLAQSMHAVFGVECNFRQNCGGGSTYIGSFQQGIPYVRSAERKLGGDLVRMNALVQEGKIDQGVYTHMLAAAEQGRARGSDRGRLHHMYATMLALTEHVRMEQALQARTNNQFERAGAHVVFQFSPGNVGSAVNSGRDRNSPWGTRNGIPRGYTVFEAIRLAASGQYKHADKIRRGITSMNCESDAGYAGASGFGDTQQPRRNVFTESGFSSTPLGRFLGISQPEQPGGDQQLPEYSAGYLDPSRNPALRPENDPSQRRGASSGGASSGGGWNVPTASNRQSPIAALTDEVRSTDASPATRATPSPTASSQDATTQERRAAEAFTGVSPTLLCLPSPIAPGEETLIFWACRDGATQTVGEAFTTDSATIGVARVAPAADTTYTVTCINTDSALSDTASSCTIDVVEPEITFTATPTRVARGGTTTLSWDTRDTVRCVLTSRTHSGFTREGVAGSSVSPALYADDAFLLACEARTGVRLEARVTVDVE